MPIPENVVPAPNVAVTTLPQFSSVGQHLHAPHLMQFRTMPHVKPPWRPMSSRKKVQAPAGEWSWQKPKRLTGMGASQHEEWLTRSRDVGREELRKKKAKDHLYALHCHPWEEGGGK
jgi:hypothetical protein